MSRYNDADRAETARRLNPLALLTKHPAISIGLVYLLLIIVFALLSPRFLTLSNFSIIIGQSSAVMIAAFAMTMVILSGGIDLSVGAIVALSGVTVATLMQMDVPMTFAIIGALAASAAVGLLNGFVTVKWSVQPFLVTLGTLSVARGIAEYMADGGTVPILNFTFGEIFAGRIAGVPVALFWTLLFLVFSIVVLRHTLFGRRLYFIGGNEAAAVQAGTRVEQVKMLVYLLSGLFAGFAGLISAARLSSGLPGAGIGFELDVIAAVVLGGTGFRGEGGSVVGTMFGALIIVTVSNGLTLMGVDPLIQKIVKGAIIIVAIVIEATRHQRAKAAR